MDEVLVTTVVLPVMTQVLTCPENKFTCKLRQALKPSAVEGGAVESCQTPSPDLARCSLIDKPLLSVNVSPIKSLLCR